MKARLIKSAIVSAFLFVAASSFGQCEIRNRISPDGSMMYYIEPVNFYWTESKDLKGGVVTDKENYFLALQPSPFPVKEHGHNLRDAAELKLANDTVYTLEHFDTRYMDHDSIMQLLYFIDKKYLEDFLKFEALSVKLNMGDEEGSRTYVFKLHKAAIREQLDCFVKEGDHKKKD